MIKKLWQSFAIMLVVSVYLAGSLGATFAEPMNESQLNDLSENTHWIADSCAASSTSSSSIQGSVFLLGDSISARSAAAYKSAIPNIDIDASSSRSITKKGIDGNMLSGLAAAKADKDRISNADIIVIALGTNGDNTEKNINKLLDEIEKAGGASKKIYWIDTIAVGRSDDSIMGENNRPIYAVAADRDYKVISWFKAVNSDGNPQKPAKKEKDVNKYIDASDSLGVHPTPAGSTALAELVKVSLTANDNVDGSVACQCNQEGASDDDGSLTGSTPAEKAFNYFIGGDRKLSAEASAGIVGNMMRETAGNTEKLNTRAHNDISGTHDGIVQWSTERWAALKKHEAGKNPYSLAVQLDYVWYELSEGGYKSVLSQLKKASSPESAATIFNRLYEVSGDYEGYRETNARKIFNKYGKNSGASVSSAGSVSASTACATGASSEDANLKETRTIKTPGKFITLPSRYSCSGRVTRIDSRIAANVAYFVDHFNMCADDGLASGHKSHGAGLAVDMRPKNGNSKEAWKSSTEAAAKAMGWTGDSATDPKGTVKGCATYVGYGSCGAQGGNTKFPKWLRWLGYNGDVDHGDPWHVFGGSYAHIHIGWDTPNSDGVSPTMISKPRSEVYVFPAPVPDDLKNLIGSE